MNTPAQIAKHLREVYFGGNWTWSNLKDNLEGVTWQDATTQVYGFNTIATLVYHVSYYVTTVMEVLKGGPLSSSDKLSFDTPPVQSAEDWDKLVNKVWADVTEFADLVEKLPEERLGETFTDEKYGIYYRNLHGIIEHTHYHLGQIALIKKIIAQDRERGRIKS
jgi:uncharacterized damage-inducible protein DinB